MVLVVLTRPAGKILRKYELEGYQKYIVATFYSKSKEQNYARKYEE